MRTGQILKMITDLCGQVGIKSLLEELQLE